MPIEIPEPTASFTSGLPWNPQRPFILVVACSDGRLQSNLDEFLSETLQITQYDRIYLPGGPGALATSGVEYVRSDLHRRELEFLITAHQIEELILIFHGPSADGPAEALCADYVRIMNRADVPYIRTMQERDLLEVVTMLREKAPSVVVHGFRCEVGPNGQITFVQLPVD